MKTKKLGNNLFAQAEKYVDKYKLIILAVAIAVLIALPFFGLSRTTMRLIVMILVYSVLGMGLNVLVGYTGLVSLGHAGFYAIGAYCSALLSTKLGMNFWLSVLCAALLTAFVGLALGLPTLRLSGTYLSIITLGFCEIVIMVLKQWESVTNGNYGVRNIPKPSIFGIECNMSNGGFYWIILGMALLTALALSMIKNSKVGRAMFAVKGDEIAATMMGIKTSKYKILAFVISAFITGMVGAFYSTINNGFIEPANFTFDVSIVILSVVIVGGMGTTRGMFFGAILLQTFPEFTRFLNEWRYVFYGLLLVLMMRFRPQGALGWQSTLPYKLPKLTRQALEKRKTEAPSKEAERG